MGEEVRVGRDINIVHVNEGGQIHRRKKMFLTQINPLSISCNCSNHVHLVTILYIYPENPDLFHRMHEI